MFLNILCILNGGFKKAALFVTSFIKKYAEVYILTLAHKETNAVK